ncbi:triose-phosphate isomerase [Epidermidibacterium keratini]|uniref:Triosephosphate isomerase n=1 Tax=Epidermidibacterium keratini TaxID=1891644 RepID=A0A7L4YS93_9ACTN|nr:triose-phosphate isomerase [Epidermidibacterium keratini]QHC02131.1 triose-phosphate isomerase [Epidermidibacterium keratini]
MAQQSTRKPLVAGNWKMNLTHLEAIALVQKVVFSLDEKTLDQVEVVVLPPFVSLRGVQTLVDGDKLEIEYGAQDVSAHESGAYTGEVSASMLAKLGCAFVTVGHSERREYHHEDDALVNAKAKIAFAHGIIPIVCVGEGLEVREAGEHVSHVVAQVAAALEGVPAEQAKDIVIAYEPVWAIGTGKTATPEDAQEVCSAIRDQLADLYSGDLADGVRILYGGSVKPDNTAALASQPDVDGSLVGGASLDGEQFAAICKLTLEGDR